MIKYIVACAIIFAVLIFLKFLENSPLRSWKAVFFSAVLLSVSVCYYLHWAFPPPSPPLPRAKKALANAAELQRTFRRIADVDQASIEGSIIKINFAEEKSLDELKRIALDCGYTAANFMRDKKDFKITVHISVRGGDRYQVIIPAEGGAIEEQTF
ncbi:MAG: hypothetical protein M3Y82_08870 [Verrucomicrobiota bacterium]|nr:hypothetical protein [Verrucomicrobiota bacterium]